MLFWPLAIPSWLDAVHVVVVESDDSCLKFKKKIFYYSVLTLVVIKSVKIRIFCKIFITKLAGYDIYKWYDRAS